MAKQKQVKIQNLIGELLLLLEGRHDDTIEPAAPLRPGLLETPERVAKAMAHWFSGYDKDPADLFKVFEDGAEGADQIVAVCNIPLYSHCEHHMAPIIGHVTIGYIPNGKIIGLSKLNKLVELFGRRLQVQERLTNQIADCIQEHLKPLGVGVYVSARHLCVESRGVEHTCTNTVTTALRGSLLNDKEVRREFLDTARANTTTRS